MRVYYNENDRRVAEWLRRLISVGLLPDGDVDERDIREVKDLSGYDQVHLFAGIGGWPYALQLAGWDGPVWTGSCPCQPFSNAGHGAGEHDERHLWPEMLRLIEECRPPTIFGEQVASPAGRKWFARVRADLEALGYGVGGADLCAACCGPKELVEVVDEFTGKSLWQGYLAIGPPHIRQRLFWVGHAVREGLPLSKPQTLPGAGRQVEGRATQQPGFPFWTDCPYVKCRDGKARRVKPGVQLVADGVPGRVAALHGIGNAVVPQLAAEFVGAFLAI